MRWIGLVVALMFVAESSFSNGIDVFKSEVYPLLKTRCSECHGVNQFPLHSVDDPLKAYKDALKTLNINFPEQSPLWIRSFNNHCGKEKLCGYQQDSLLSAIQSWIFEEAKSNDNDNYEYISEVEFVVPDQIGEQDETILEFLGPEQEIYQFKVRRISETFLSFSDLQIGNVETYSSFTGLKLVSSSLQFQSQNFSHYQLVVKPTAQFIQATPFGGRYILAQLSDQPMETIKIQLDLKGRQSHMAYENAKFLSQQGHFLPLSQGVLSPKIKSLSIGGFHSCIQYVTDTIKCFGFNVYGQLGYGDRRGRGDNIYEMGKNLNYVNISSTEVIREVRTGVFHSCVVFQSGRVKCWGGNAFGQLGNGHTENKADDKYETGDNIQFVPLGLGVKVKKIKVGGDHNCVLLESSQVKCWGSNKYGQLGYGDNEQRGDSANEMGDQLPFVKLSESDVVRSLHLSQYYSGHNFSCAVFESGRVKCWGYNALGQLGAGDKEARGDEPGEMGEKLSYIALGEGDGVESLATGSLHACALFQSGKIKCWGYNIFGQLGYGQKENIGDNPGEMGNNLAYVDLGTDLKVKSIQLGTDFSCALFDNGQMKCWGFNSVGQLGYGHTLSLGDQPNEMGDNLPFIQLGENNKVKSFGVGSRSVCVLFESGQVKCWGANSSGQLGYEDRVQRGDQPDEMGENLSFLDFGQSYGFD